MATRTISAAGGASNVAATYDEVAVPTASDDIVCRGDGTSGAFNIPASTTLACRSLDFTNYSSTFTLNNSSVLTIGTSSVPASNVALKLVPAMTLTRGTGVTLNFVSTTTGGTVTTAGLTSGGVTFGTVTFNGAGGGWTLQDAISSNGTITLTAGTLNTNGQSVTCGTFNSNNSNTRTLTLGSSTITCTQASGNGWVLTTTTNLTVTANTATVICSGATVTFIGGGFNYNGMSLRFTGTGTATVTGANTFATLERSNAVAVTLVLPASATTTVTTLTINGTSGNLVTLQSSSAGTAATISKSSGTVTADWVSLKDSTATGGATFRATNATNVSNNTGWTFVRSLAGTAAITTGVPNAALPVTHPLGGSAALTSGTSGPLRVSHTLSGSTAITSGVPNVMLRVSHALAGVTAITTRLTPVPMHGGRATPNIRLLWPPSVPKTAWSKTFWLSPYKSAALLVGDGGCGFLTIYDSARLRAGQLYLDAADSKIKFRLGTTTIASSAQTFGAGAQLLIGVAFSTTTGMRLSVAVLGGATQHVVNAAAVDPGTTADYFDFAYYVNFSTYGDSSTWGSDAVWGGDTIYPGGVVDNNMIFEDVITTAEFEALAAATVPLGNLPQPEGRLAWYAPYDVAPIVTLDAESGGRKTDPLTDTFGFQRAIAFLKTNHLEAAAILGRSGDPIADQHAQSAAEFDQQVRVR